MEYVILAAQVLLGLLLLWGKTSIEARLRVHADLDAKLERLDDVNKLLKSNTEAVEQIKTEVAHLHWIRQQRLTLLREKLEQAIAAAYDADSAMSRFRDTILEEHLVDTVESTLYKGIAICDCYFPDLRLDVASLMLAAIKHRQVMIQRRFPFRIYVIHYEADRHADANQAKADFDKVFADTAEEVQSTYAEFSNARTTFVEAAAAKMQEFIPNE